MLMRGSGTPVHVKNQGGGVREGFETATWMQAGGITTLVDMLTTAIPPRRRERPARQW